ncbi:MAG: EAL domain-containing protein [Mogibacterium sp.]|nr:EAL domain-containing protein [Mogibacterium sp.]
MPESHVKFHSMNGKRRVLIVDDEMINREMLGNILSDKYETVYACSGTEAVEIMQEQHETLSIVLLDLIMPDMYGLDVLEIMKSDERLRDLPVIVTTSDRKAEVESLNLGAIDFIPKPYPDPGVIHARVQRTIELYEDRDTIRVTERDQLTGLYNRDYFYHYADQYDIHHRETPMDAIVLDVNHFHMINERHGKAYGDTVLKRIGELVRNMVMGDGGIVCRREADTFMIYCPHRSDYSDILEAANSGLAGDEKAGSMVRFRMGVYANADKAVDVERRFDRAKMAADAVRNNLTRNISIYDDSMHSGELLHAQLLDNFQAAIDQHQFEVYYQPKYNILGNEPVLCSAEALVRWQHPELGRISPGEFIPLFEENGLIRQLDNYVWEATAAQISDWRERLGTFVPVSVNVSRVDMFDSDIVSTFTSILKDYSLSSEDLVLEITESAYTEDSEQIIDAVNRLRDCGFRIEMDDFGTGYSSLNMLTSLPIDALKLDMQFIRSAFSARKDTRMLEVILDISDSLSVPTIAEGVETAEQLFTLKSMGCDIVQGYYFSRPVPAEEFEVFLSKRRRKDNGEEDPQEKELMSAEFRKIRAARRSGRKHDRFAYDALHDPVTGLYNSSAYDMLYHDADHEHSAILIASVNGFRNICKEYGMKAGDQILQRTADALRRNFRSVDYVCRIAGNEFAVIVTRCDSSMKELIREKIDLANETLSVPENGLPAVSLAVGAAFGDRENPAGDLFEDADAALIHLKDRDGSGCEFF